MVLPVPEYNLATLEPGKKQLAADERR